MPWICKFAINLLPLPCWPRRPCSCRNSLEWLQGRESTTQSGTCMHINSNNIVLLCNRFECSEWSNNLVDHAWIHPQYINTLGTRSTTQTRRMTLHSSTRMPRFVLEDYMANVRAEIWVQKLLPRFFCVRKLLLSFLRAHFKHFRGCTCILKKK